MITGDKHTKISLPEYARLFYPDVHWSMGRVTELCMMIESSIIFELTIVNNIPRYKEIKDEDNL